MATINRHAAHGGGIHFFGVEQLDQAGLAKLMALASIAAVDQGVPPFLVIHGTPCELIAIGGRPRQERLACAGNAALEAGNDRLAQENTAIARL